MDRPAPESPPGHPPDRRPGPGRGHPSGAEPDARRGLVADDVWLARAGRSVLEGASLHVPPGLVTALIAPSGAGKSTLLRCMNGLLRPDRGTITLDGVAIETVPPRRLRQQVGLVAQAPVMLPGTVAENIAYGLADPPDVVAIRSALHQAGLDETFAPRDAAGLSGGERARVALARALVRRPVALLLDEPTAALDAAVAEQVGETLRARARDGVAICLAIHDLLFAHRVADRIVDLTGATVPPDPPATGAPPVDPRPPALPPADPPTHERDDR